MNLPIVDKQLTKSTNNQITNKKKLPKSEFFFKKVHFVRKKIVSLHL